MDLLDRYLTAVGALLPKTEREDIVAELRDILLNRMEERQAQSGRPLSAAEQEAILHAYGHPLAVAARYGPQRALIGPSLYPYYEFALKVALALTAAVILIGAVLAMAGDAAHAPRLIGQAMHDFMGAALTLVGAFTLIGAAIERGWIQTKFLADWRVADLPVMVKPGAKARKSKPWGDTVFELAATLLVIAWLTGLISGPRVDAGDLGLFAIFAPLWGALKWPVVGLCLLQVAANVIDLARPGWVRARSVPSLAMNLGFAAVVVVLWRSAPGLSLHDLRSGGLTVENILIVALAIFAVSAAIDLKRLATGR